MFLCTTVCKNKTRTFIFHVRHIFHSYTSKTAAYNLYAYFIFFFFTILLNSLFDRQSIDSRTCKAMHSMLVPSWKKKCRNLTRSLVRSNVKFSTLLIINIVRPFMCNNRTDC